MPSTLLFRRDKHTGGLTSRRSVGGLGRVGMRCYWLITWRTYGTWLPGEAGFVSEFRDRGGRKVLLNTPGEPTADANPKLAAYSARIMDEEAVHLTPALAKAVADQLRETARIRQWQLLALAVLTTHVHVVIGVPEDLNPERALADFKAWCTRRLNQQVGPRKHWWVQSGSIRKKATPTRIRGAVEYVRDQEHPLVVWLEPRIAERLNGAT